MNLISTFLGFIGITIPGIYVLYKAPRKIVNISYFFMAVTIGIWAFTHWLLQLSFAGFIDNPLFLGRLTFFVGCLGPPSYILFSMVFPHSESWPRRSIIFLIYIIALAFAAVSFTNFYVVDIVRREWGFDWIFNKGFFVFNIFLLTYIVLGIFILARQFISTTGMTRLQVKYMLFSTAITGSFITITNSILPLIGYDRLVPLGPSSTLVLLAATAYAILRYKLLDIEVIISKIVLFSSTIFIVFIFHIGFIYFARPFVGYDVANLTSLGVIFLILLFTPLSHKAQDIINTLVYRGRYDYREVLRESAKALVTMLDLDTLLNYFINIIVKNIGVARAVLFLKDREGPRYRPSASYGIEAELKDKIALFEGSGIIDWLKTHKTVFIKQAVEMDMPADTFAQLYGGLGKIKAEVLIPLFYKGAILGVLSLDNKVSGGAYSSDDLDILETIAHEASVAIENARLFGESITDSLTGLFHHKYFQQRLSDEVERSRRFKQPLSLLMIDIDHFKEFNDKYGHQVGDKVLEEVAEILKHNCRAIDIPARYGGEELALIVPHSHLSGEMAIEEHRKFAQGLAERLRKKVEEAPFKHEDENLKLTVSVGVATVDFSRQVSDKDELIRLADTALYKAKNAGRNRVEAA